MDLAGKINKIIAPIIDRLEHARNMYATIGQILVGEFKKNIETGRPPQWPVSKAALRRHGQTLRKTGFLMRSNVYNATDAGVTAGPSAFYGKFLFYGVTRAARGELFQRNRISRGKNKGQFKRLAPGMNARGISRGFTFRQYSFGPWDLLYVPEDAMGRIRQTVAGEVMR